MDSRDQARRLPHSRAARERRRAPADKQGYDYAERYPLIVEAIWRLKVTSIVIDGEAMCFTGAMHDFDKLWNRTHDHEAKLCAFELDGEDHRLKPLAEHPHIFLRDSAAMSRRAPFINKQTDSSV